MSSSILLYSSGFVTVFLKIIAVDKDKGIFHPEIRI